MKDYDVRLLGRIDYATAMKLQLDEKQKVISGESTGAIFILEHDPPVITLGRHSFSGNILYPESVIEQNGYRVVQTDRGGDATVHEPGQIVVYYVLPVKSKHTSDFVMSIVNPVIDLLKSYLNTEFHYSKEKPGIWHGMHKCVSVGFDLRGGVSSHGIAINVCNTLKGFSLINPCGMESSIMTTLSQASGRDISVKEITDQLVLLYHQSRIL